MERRGPQFAESVEERLASNEDAHELWLPIAHEFVRDGPDAAKEYLDAVGQQLEDRVINLLEQYAKG